MATTEHPTQFKPAAEYRGVVVRVVDGDTIRVRLDLGFETCTTVDIRVAELHAPEKNGEELAKGLEAKAVAEELLPPNTPIVITTSRRSYTRSFTRYVAELWWITETDRLNVALRLRTTRPDLFSKHSKAEGGYGG